VSYEGQVHGKACWWNDSTLAPTPLARPVAAQLLGRKVSQAFLIDLGLSNSAAPVESSKEETFLPFSCEDIPSDTHMNTSLYQPEVCSGARLSPGRNSYFTM
jgi:hypothetical protein